MIDTSLYQFHENIENDIREYGRSIVCVGGEPGFEPFAYTIGNQAKGMPELLVIGTFYGAILNQLSEQMLQRGSAFLLGELVDLGGKQPVKVVTADARAQNEYTIQASEHYGTDNYVVQQVLIPDHAGRFPDDPEWERSCSRIPVLRSA